MRKIEKEMLDALHEGGAYLNGNMSITYDSDAVGGIEAEVRLFGNLIARRYRGGSWGITLAGWNTPTTRSRLSAILREFVPGVSGIGSKKGQAYIAYTCYNRDIGNDEWTYV